MGRMRKGKMMKKMTTKRGRALVELQSWDDDWRNSSMMRSSILLDGWQ